MIESLFAWLSQHSAQAPLWIFCLLLLTGFSIPISEDALVIASGVLAGSILPEQRELLFLAAFFGAYFSDWVAYLLGRLLGTKISHMKCFCTRWRVAEEFFKNHGFFTLFFGRLIPFGIRNSLFMAAGALKMHFGRFILSDGMSCFLFSSIVFALAFRCGENYADLHSFLLSMGYVVAFLATGGTIGLLLWNRHVKKAPRHDAAA